MKRITCAICKKQDVPDSSHYPNLVCASCEGKAIDSDSNKVSFYNESIGGGLIAHHTTINGYTTKDYNFVCFIQGVECHGVEFKFGGTGIIVGSEAI